MGLRLSDLQEPLIAAQLSRLALVPVSGRHFVALLFGAATAGALMLAAVNGTVRPSPPRAQPLERGGSNAREGFLQVGLAPRLVPSSELRAAGQTKRIDVPTIITDQGLTVVRNVPFRYVSINLAAMPAVATTYPPFGEANFTRGGAVAPGIPMIPLYGERTDGQFAFHLSPLVEEMPFSDADALTDDAAEEQARRADLADAARQSRLETTEWIDPVRFGAKLSIALAIDHPPRAKVISENVSFAPISRRTASPRFSEDFIELSWKQAVGAALEAGGYDKKTVEHAASALQALVGAKPLSDNGILRVGVERSAIQTEIVRLTLYGQGKHIATVGRDDEGKFVESPEPALNPAVAALYRGLPQPGRAFDDLPTLYDALNQAAALYGVPADVSAKVIGLLASQINVQSRLAADDRLQLFFSDVKGDNPATGTPELYFLRISLGGVYRSLYRYPGADGTVAFFSPEGRGTSALLLRKPVTKAVLRSGFGMRIHPILGEERMHTGVDWAAPSGTPILAAGNGVVESAGWHGDYGRQTTIRHSGGFVTSYAHQSRIAPEIVPGVYVSQGQVIGYVGATGLATGPHLHYEIALNGVKVDPATVRLPAGRTLRGDDLDNFLGERDRIDALLYDQQNGLLKIASATR